MTVYTAQKQVATLRKLTTEIEMTLIPEHVHDFAFKPDRVELYKLGAQIAEQFHALICEVERQYYGGNASHRETLDIYEIGSGKPHLL